MITDAFDRVTFNGLYRNLWMSGRMSDFNILEAMKIYSRPIIAVLGSV